MTAREEMSRFGFDQNQEPHPIFERLSKLRNMDSPTRAVEREIAKLEQEIEQSMIDAEKAFQAMIKKPWSSDRRTSNNPFDPQYQ